MPPQPPNPSLRLALVGAGAVGSEAGRQLARAGYRDVLVIDPDRLEGRNLLTSSFYAGEAEQRPVLGLAKAVLLVEFAARDHGHAWRPLEREVADAGLGDLSDRDLLLSCTDSALARVETAFAARALRLPMLDAAVRDASLPEARLTFFSRAPTAACFLCGFSARRRAEILAYALSTSLACALPSRFAAMSGTSAAARAVATAMLAAIPGAVAAAPESFAEILSIHPAGTHAQRIHLSAGDACPWHALPPLEARVPLDDDAPFASALAGSDAVLDLPWPICVRALCRVCGAHATPYRRAAFTRRRAQCPACAATGTLDPLECLSSIRCEDAFAGATPRRLGLPANQLYHRRRPFDAQHAAGEASIRPPGDQGRA